MDDRDEAADPPEDLEGEDDEERGLRDQLFRAKDQLTHLAEGTIGQVDDPELCLDLAQQVKPYTDRLHALRQAIYCCRKGGTVSIPGVYGGLLDKVPFGAAFAKYCRSSRG